jgi:hypothetical protein
VLISFSARPNPNAVAVTIRSTGSEGSGKSIPDLHRTIKDVWVSGDKAFVRVEATGMPVRTFLGAQPTGRSFKTMFLAIFVIRNQKITFFYHVETGLPHPSRSA